MADLSEPSLYTENIKIFIWPQDSSRREGDLLEKVAFGVAGPAPASALQSTACTWASCVFLCSFRHNYERYLQAAPLSSSVLEKFLSVRTQHHMSGCELERMAQVMVPALILLE